MADLPGLYSEREAGYDQWEGTRKSGNLLECIEEEDVRKDMTV